MKQRTIPIGTPEKCKHRGLINGHPICHESTGGVFAEAIQGDMIYAPDCALKECPRLTAKTGESQ